MKIINEDVTICEEVEQIRYVLVVDPGNCYYDDIAVISDDDLRYGDDMIYEEIISSGQIGQVGQKIRVRRRAFNRFEIIPINSHDRELIYPYRCLSKWDFTGEVYNCYEEALKRAIYLSEQECRIDNKVREWKEYAEKRGWELNTRTIDPRGQAKLVLEKGRACPCLPDKRPVCPCPESVKEVEENGWCCCKLFVDVGFNDEIPEIR